MIRPQDRVAGNHGSALFAVLIVCASLVLAIPASRVTGDELPWPGVTESIPDQGSSWKMRGRVSIHNLQFGPATLRDKDWHFLGNTRTFNAGAYGDRLTLMIRFGYRGLNPDNQLKFIIKLPAARPYEDIVRLPDRQGTYTYRFTIHDPAGFLGSGSVYLYYGFSLVSAFDFTIMPGS